MEVEVITKAELEQFRQKLLEEISSLINSMPTRKRWLKSSEVMEMLDVSDVTLATLRKNGTLPYVRIGRIYYFDTNDIDWALDNLKVRDIKRFPKQRSK